RRRPRLTLAGIAARGQVTDPQLNLVAVRAGQAHPAVDLLGPRQRQRLAQPRRELFRVGHGLGPAVSEPAAQLTVEIAAERLAVGDRAPRGTPGPGGIRPSAQRRERAGEADPGGQQPGARRGQVLVPDVERARGRTAWAAVAGLIPRERVVRGPAGR